MVSQTVTTNKEGLALANLNPLDNGDYTVEVSFNGDSKYSSQTLTKSGQEVFKGYETRIIINNSPNTTVNSKYLDNTRLVFKVQYRKDSDDTWKDKQNWSIKVQESGQVWSVNNLNSSLDFTNYLVGSYTLTCTYEGDNNYQGSTNTYTLVQSKNNCSFIVTDYSLYVDDDSVIGGYLRTTEGKVVEGVQVSLVKQENTYTTITDNTGFASFSNSLSNDDYMISIDTDGHDLTEESSTFEITKLSDNHEYIININNFTGFSVTLDSYVFTFSSELVSVDNGLFVKEYARTYLNPKLRFTLHQGVFRATFDDELIYSDSVDSFTNDILVKGIVSIGDIQLNELPDSSVINSDTLSISFGGNNNLNSCTGSFDLEKKELLEDTGFEYFVDTYPSSKLVNYYSTLSFDVTNVTEYGFFYEDTDYSNINSFKVSDYVSVDGADSFSLVFYRKKRNYVENYTLVSRSIHVALWRSFLSDEHGHSIFLRFNNTSPTIDTTLNGYVYLDVPSKQVKIYKDNLLYTTVTTGSDGGASFTYTPLNTTPFVIRAVFEEDSEYMGAISEDITIIPQRKQSSISITNISGSRLKDNLTVTGVLNCNDASEDMSGETVKVYRGSTLLGSATTTSGGAFTLTKSSIGKEYFGTQNYRCEFEGNSDVGSSNSSTSKTVGKYQPTLSISVSPTSFKSGKVTYTCTYKFLEATTHTLISDYQQISGDGFPIPNNVNVTSANATATILEAPFPTRTYTTSWYWYIRTESTTYEESATSNKVKVSWNKT